MSKKILFQFPGQGSQAVGMGMSLADAHPEARAVFDEVNEALGRGSFRDDGDGPEEDLRLTRNAQPALFAASMAAFAVLREATGRDITDLASFVAGHSLGEYSALAAAGFSVDHRRGAASSPSGRQHAERGSGRRRRHGGDPRCRRSRCR